MTAAAPSGPTPPLPARRAVRDRTRRVRPYALTGGRTGAARVLRVETVVVAIEAPEERPELLSGGLRGRVQPELRALVEICRRMRSVAEIAALMRMPLGVVKVLLGDLADQGRVRVYDNGRDDFRPDRDLLERVLSGLRRL